MTILAFFFCVGVVVLLHIKVVSKNKKKANRIVITLTNILLSAIFFTYLVIMSTVQNNSRMFIEQHIDSLQKKVESSYPGLLDKPLGAAEIKPIMVTLVEKDRNHSVDAVNGNLAKIFMENYSLAILKSIQSLEKEEGETTVKAALLSMKTSAYDEALPVFTTLKLALFIGYMVFIILSATITLMLSSTKISRPIFKKKKQKAAAN